MCFDQASSASSMAGNGPATAGPSILDIVGAGVGGASGGGGPKPSTVSKVANNPLTQGAAAAAGTALAPATGGLSLLIPVAAKIFGGIFGGKKQKVPNSNVTGPDPNAGLDLLARSNSFGGM